MRRYPNGCAYCCRLHAQEARSFFSQQKLDALVTWQHDPAFTEEERIVLAWIEAVTTLKNLAAAKEALFKIYDEKQVVDLTACIAIMNALNRIAISLRDHGV